MTMPPTLTVRHAVPADADALATFVERAFRDTFAAENTPADLDLYCAAAFTPEAFGANPSDVDAAAARLICIRIVAEVDGGVAGYAQLVAGVAAPNVPGAAPIELQRFYIDRPYHGRGLAHLLMARCVEDTLACGRDTLWLGVWERNSRAIRFYERCGFRTVGAQQFMMGTDAQRDLVMARPL